MNDALKMQISAFVDGELPENESELLLRRLSQDVALRNQADGYLRIGRLIRRERELPQIGQLRKRIAASLGEQPMEVAAALPEPSSRYVKPAAGLAIAASVAILALVGLRQAEIPGAPESAVTSVVATPSSVTPSLASPAGYTEPSPDEAASRPGDMLTQYYLSHGATSADLGANGILTRLVTLELREGELREDAAEEARASPEDDERQNGN